MKNSNKQKIVSLGELSGLCKRLLSIALVIALIAPATNVSFAYDTLDANEKNILDDSTNVENENEGEVETSGKDENNKEESETPEEGILFKDAFDDENFKRYIRFIHKEAIDEDNFRIYSDTFKDVYKINVYNYDIKSLKGIEYFGSIEDLNIGNNKINKLDLSNNKNLSTLICYGNLLSTLDLSNNKNLMKVICFENNLTKLVLPEQSDLIELDASFNKLTKLELFNNTKIKKLSSKYNELTSLNLKNLTYLKELELESNKLTTLNLYNNINLEKLNCRSNKLSNLDLSKNIDLLELNCSYNKLNSIDLSKNKNIHKANLEFQVVEYELTRHNGQYSIYIGKNYNSDNIKLSVEVVKPTYGQYSDDGYIDLGNSLIFIDDYSYAKFNRIYTINDIKYIMDISADIKKSEVGKPEETTTTELLNGTDRYDTSIKISKNGFTTAENVILVNDTSLPDALSVTPYAKAKNAPILLTKNNVLNTKTRNEIERLNAKKIYIIGGANSVNTSVEKELIDKGYRVERISGEDRYITSLNIARELNKSVNIKEVVVVNGVKGIPDAVSAAGISAQKGMPVLLTSETDNMNNITSFLNTAGVNKSYIVGGAKLFPTDISEKLPSPINIYGSNRNETNIKVINNFYSQSELNNAYICKNGMLRQDDLIDALSVGVLSAKNQSPVMLVGNSLDNSQKDLVKNKKFKVITQVGGNGNENAFNELKNSLK
jgi:putative cell wall-binding protein/Leucine-rich repeat (LRR) protein